MNPDPTPPAPASLPLPDSWGLWFHKDQPWVIRFSLLTGNLSGGYWFTADGDMNWAGAATGAFPQGHWTKAAPPDELAALQERVRVLEGVLRKIDMLLLDIYSNAQKLPYEGIEEMSRHGLKITAAAMAAGGDDGKED